MHETQKLTISDLQISRSAPELVIAKMEFESFVTVIPRYSSPFWTTSFVRMPVITFHSYTPPSIPKRLLSILLGENLVKVFLFGCQLSRIVFKACFLYSIFFKWIKKI